MRFKTDENVHPDVAEYLRQQGHDALTVWDEALRGTADDHLAQVCQAERRALITLDLDFADIRSYPPEQFAGMIVLRLSSQSRSHVLQSVARLLPLLTENSVAGHLWIVDEQHVRVRGEDTP
jgi:predicted nuclease of predicted toxin-antitoxin system